MKNWTALPAENTYSALEVLIVCALLLRGSFLFSLWLYRAPLPFYSCSRLPGGLGGCISWTTGMLLMRRTLRANETVRHGFGVKDVPAALRLRNNACYLLGAFLYALFGAFS